MSDLGIFSPLVVGRDMPHPFADSQTIPRSADCFTPIARDSRRSAQATTVEPDEARPAYVQACNS
jgi:hypothetical protein